MAHIFSITSLSKRSEQTQIFIWTLVGAGFGVIFAGILIPDTNNSENYAGTVIVVTLLSWTLLFGGVSAALYLLKLRWLKKRSTLLYNYAIQNNITLVAIMSSAYLHLTSTMLELGKRDVSFTNVFSKDGWTFGDYSYAIYRKTKHGEYKAETVYYSVCYVTLPRKLPNIFFDAKATRGREYKKIFDDSQRHSLEGNFDTYFDTYFPTHYTIDSLSFITPEVMQALVAAKDYDIEINQDKLYLYCRLKPMPQQLHDMTSSATDIYTKLMNNIVTYRDERLNYADGRSAVSLAGMRLRRSLFTKYVSAFFGALLLAGSGVCVAYQYGGGALYLLAFGLGFLLDSLKYISNERAFRRLADTIHANSSKI